MAAHNYYGFTPGGTLSQYSGYGTPAAAYTQSTTPSPYAAAQTTVPTQYGPYGSRVQTYDDPSSYYTAAQAGYGASATGFGQAVGSSVSASKPSAYYQLSAASSGGAAASSYYSQPTSVTRLNAGVKKAEVKASEWQSLPSSAGDAGRKGSGWQSSSMGATNYPAYTETTSTQQPMTGLDKALFTIAANYCQQKVGGGGGGGARHGGGGGSSGGGGGPGAGGTAQRAMWWNKKGKMPTDPSQWKYCELCKMTCPGSQAYKLHLEGKIHKKKESMAASKSIVGPKLPSQNIPGRVAYCSVCETYCSSNDAYKAHIRGIKHQKVVKLMMRMGKPIPDDAAGTVGTTGASASTAGRAVTATRPASAGAASKKVYCPPRINFVGGTQLKTTSGQPEEVSIEPRQPEPRRSFAGSSAGFGEVAAALPDDIEEGSSDADVQPVGLEYIEEGLNEARTAPSFHCKLCDCSFTDVLGKLMHSKGRRHRMSYKKKVDPTLKVEVKVNPFDRRAQLEKLRRNRAIPEQWRKRELQATYRMEAEELRYEKEVLQWKLQEVIGGRYVGPSGAAAGGGGGKAWQQRGASDNSAQQAALIESIGRCIQTRHMAIYPTEAELMSVQSLISVCEKSLKLLSDFFAERDTKKLEDGKAEGQAPPRVLKGVMRVGLLCKGLLLQGSLGLQLIVLCADKPTRTLVQDIADNLPKQLEACGGTDKFEVATDGNDLLITRTGEDSMSCTISLTSPSVKAETVGAADSESNPADMLDEEKCVLLLAELRHAKWFQAKVSPMQSCLVVIRILMDLCNREPDWSPLSQWALELLVEKCATSGFASNSGTAMSPAALFLRVFECISGGILLPGGPGLYDVCEKEPTDVIGTMTNQQREHITASAQLMLRQMLCGLAHEVLDIDGSSSSGNGATQSKRARISSL